MNRFLIVTITVGVLIAVAMILASHRYSVTTQSAYVSIRTDHWTGRVWIIYGGKIQELIEPVR